MVSNVLVRRRRQFSRIHSSARSRKCSAAARSRSNSAPSRSWIHLLGERLAAVAEDELLHDLVGALDDLC
jgi:hypothetical protein